MNSSHSRFSPGNLIHKFRSFSNHLRKDPGGAVRRLRGYFRPPLFLFHVNDKRLLHFTYERYLENRIRDAYPFEGTPIRLSFRERKREEE